jgi:Skp family chaperone for outer membrane proteins
MSDNNIQIILDKKYVVMANSKTDLTNEILKILDSQLKSIDLK